MKSLTLVLLFAASAMAAPPSGVVVYKAPQLKAYNEKLRPKVDEMKVAVQQLDDFGNYNTLVVHREATGQVEIHEHYADVFVIVSGSATLLSGGHAEGAKPTGDGEFRGGEIQEGERQALAPGDIVHIPAQVPHQVVLEPGQSFTYFVLKVQMK